MAKPQSCSMAGSGDRSTGEAQLSWTEAACNLQWIESAPSVAASGGFARTIPIAIGTLRFVVCEARPCPSMQSRCRRLPPLLRLPLIRFRAAVRAWRYFASRDSSKQASSADGLGYTSMHPACRSWLSVKPPQSTPMARTFALRAASASYGVSSTATASLPWIRRTGRQVSACRHPSLSGCEPVQR